MYAVVKALVALRGRRVQAVGGESAGGNPVRRPHAGIDRAGETDALRSEEGQHEYANPAIHIVKDNVFFEIKIAEFAIILELNGYSDCLKIR